jgi:hypothetical protein
MTRDEWEELQERFDKWLERRARRRGPRIEDFLAAQQAQAAASRRVADAILLQAMMQNLKKGPS